MNHHKHRWQRALASLCWLMALAAVAQGQTGSLLYAPVPGPVAQQPMRGISQDNDLLSGPATSVPPLPLEQYAGAGAVGDPAPLLFSQASWTYQPPAPIRVFNKNDIITIRVDEITRMQAEGVATGRKQTLYEAVLSDWIQLDNFRLRPDKQANGDPTVATESNSNFRANSTVASRESLTFNIGATVVDIRPNGSLLLEARKTIRVNDNLWETSLTGLCRVQDIGPDNVVLSKDLIDLEIRKEDQGHLRDGYKRGWFQRWLDRVQPF
jgi:flagellar L-ring protein FlgH